MTSTTPITVPDVVMTDEERWQAVLARDHRFDGTFLYAVQTTGIYCRPSCPARRPRPEHVRFFTSATAAEAAGFRPCRRCQPREATNPQVALVERVQRWIEEHVDETITLATLGDTFGVSPTHLQRTFKRHTGVTPRQYAEAIRLDRVKARLQAGDDVMTALYDAGYGSSSRLYERARTQLGMTPATYRRGGKGVRIHYTIVDSPFGRLLVAATAHGICAVALGTDDDALEGFLTKQFPAADLDRDATMLGPWVETLLAHLSGRPTELDLPLDIDGTEFQRRVWDTLRMIPIGSTRSYREIARMLGNPGAARAVASACAANPAAIVIPCHRVVHHDGSLGGYRWGSERKARLLKHEGAR